MERPGKEGITGLASSLPIPRGQLCEARLSVMMRQMFRLRLGDLRQLRREHLHKALMILLSGAPEQRLLGGLLDEKQSKRGEVK